MNKVLNNKYRILDKIGLGKFGVVYKGIHLKTVEFVAIKTESKTSSIKLLKNETTILKYLYDNGSRSTPIVFWYGIDNQFTYLVMSYYEISLYDYSIKKQLSIEKIDKTMAVCIDILENIHSNFVLHRDIKPQNFMITNDEIYLIDFGFSAFFIDEKGNHMPMNKSENVLGTPKYISYNIHDGFFPTRRDDLISLGYIYIYLFCKELPWDSLKLEENPNQYDEIHILHPKNKQRKTMKECKNLEKISLQINQKIHKFLNYCYALKYDGLPNYNGLKALFQ